MSQSHSPGDEFEVGMHNVTYEFADDNDNVAYCVFKISVVEGNSRWQTLHVITPFAFW